MSNARPAKIQAATIPPVAVPLRPLLLEEVVSEDVLLAALAVPLDVSVAVEVNPRAADVVGALVATALAVVEAEVEVGLIDVEEDVVVEALDEVWSRIDERLINGVVELVLVVEAVELDVVVAAALAVVDVEDELVVEDVVAEVALDEELVVVVAAAALVLAVAAVVVVSSARPNTWLCARATFLKSCMVIVYAASRFCFSLVLFSWGRLKSEWNEGA